MPTAEDYRAGIIDLDRHLEEIALIQRLCDQYRDDFGFTGGASTLIRQGFIAGMVNAQDTGNSCDSFREEMEKRAMQCDQFTEDMKAYVSASIRWEQATTALEEAAEDYRYVPYPAPLGPEPQPPEPPFVGAQTSTIGFPR